MGFVVLLVAVPRGLLEPRLATGEAVAPDAPGLAGDLAARVADADAAAAEVAAAVRGGGGPLGSDAAAHLAATLLSLGDVLADLPDESVDDAERPRELLGGVPAGAVGAERVARLLRGPVAGCSTTGLPSVGRWQHEELAEVGATMAAAADELDDASTEQLLVLYACVDRALEHDRDLYAVCL